MKQIENYHKAPSESEKAMIVTDPLKIFHGAVENCKPLLTLKTIEKGGSRYRVRGIIYCKQCFYGPSVLLTLCISFKLQQIHINYSCIGEKNDNIKKNR